MFTAIRRVTLVQSLALLAALWLAWADGAQAMQQGATPLGNRYLTGGVSETETAALQERREQFSLWVITAARKTGAYLADVRVRITDSRQRVVFDAAIDGPWLFIDLPIGRYTIEARLNGQAQQRVSTIHPGDHHQAIFYFDVDADVLTQPASDASK